jgi:tetratricopeptide (TPR) repeat protein
VWRCRARWPWLAAAGLVFVAGVAPVLGLTPFMFQYTSTVADHYLYLAMLGPALAATWAIVRFRGPAVRAFAIAAVLALGVRSNLQLVHWRTDRAAWTHATDADPQSFVGPANLAMTYAREAAALADLSDAARAAGRVEEADRLARRRLAYYERAADLVERALAINPDVINARKSAFNYNLLLGRDLKAVEHLEALFALNARRPRAARADLSGLRELAATTWAKLGRYDKAAAQYRILAETSKEYRAIAEKGLAEMRTKMAEAELDPADVQP